MKDKQITSSEKGSAFEKAVEKWAKKYFKAIDTGRNLHARGKIAKRTIEIDVWVKMRLGLFKFEDSYLWIECKNRKTSIKRDDVWRFLSKAKDVRDARKWSSFIKKTDEDWDYLAIASTSKFDMDALQIAKANNIGCFYYDGKKWHIENEINVSITFM